jgi:hypothetical protein
MELPLDALAEAGEELEEEDDEDEPAAKKKASAPRLTSEQTRLAKALHSPAAILVDERGYSRGLAVCFQQPPGADGLLAGIARPGGSEMAQIVSTPTAQVVESVRNEPNAAIRALHPRDAGRKGSCCDGVQAVHIVLAPGEVAR